ncbi:MAG: nucleotidyltransferase domain-containing protein [Actinomycetota bacterium]|nr:nucleotidyltransferase domain-containing protein [Actinomycetota bacterium]
MGRLGTLALMPSPSPDHAAWHGLAVRVGARLGRCPGVRAVTLGGSWASGTADAGSDIDLGLYFDHRSPLDVARLQHLAAEVDDRGDEAVVGQPGEWGPWVNGGAWLVIEGRRVDWIYRDLDLVARTVEDVCDGRPATHFQPGHPAGFSTEIYAAEIHLAQVLFDADGVIAKLKSRLVPYPPRLRRALIAGLWEARWLIEAAVPAARRGDTHFVAGSAFRSAVCMVQALFALNGRFWLHEKGSIALVDRLERTPEGFGTRVHAVLGGLGCEPSELTASLDRLKEILAEVEVLCSGR